MVWSMFFGCLELQLVFGGGEGGEGWIIACYYRAINVGKFMLEEFELGFDA